MPDATITSTASTFGTISGVFSADQSTISGTISGIVPGTLTGSVGVPGPAGPAGIGLPAGGTSGQFLQKTSGVDYATDWVTVNLTGLATESWVTAGFYPLTGNPSSFLTASALTPYLTKADNLGSLTNFSTARDNLGLGSLSSPTFAGITAQGSGANVANLTPTSLSLTHATSGSFTIQPSSGITFPDSSVQTTAFTTAQLTNYLAKASNLSDLTSASSARTNLGLGSLAVVNDAPSDGSQYARKNGAWDVVSVPASYITSVSSPLSVTTGNLSIDLSAYAPLASPAFTGNPTAPTATFGDNDTSISTTAFVQAALAGGTAVARNLEVEVRNQSGSTIAAGSIVYISGATGNKPLITKAQANNDANSAQTIGFVKTAIANNGTGYVIVRGELENIDTSALTEGVQLYLSPTTAGTWTTTKPSAPQHLVYVGIVIRSHPNFGTILVAVQNGYELGEIHDVAIGTLANNDLLAYESSTDLWKNKTYSGLGLLTSADAATSFYPLSSNPAGYLTSAALTGYATESWVTAGFYPLTGNPSGFLTSAPVTSVAGRTGAITLSNTDISGLGSLAVVNDAPSDGSQYARKNGAWDVVSAGGGVWGSITGTLSSQTDLVTALGTKRSVNASVPIPSGESLIINDGGIYPNDVVVDNNGLEIRNGTTFAEVATFRTDQVLIPSAGITFSDASVQTSAGITADTAASTYQTIAGMSSYAPIASPALTGNVTITSNTSGAALFIEQSGTGNILTLHDQASDTTFVAIDQNGKVGTIASTTTNAGFNVPHGTAPTSPVNGDVWTTTGGLFYRINGATISPATLAGGTFTGKITTVASTTATAGFRLPSGTAPTSPTQGDIWTVSGANGSIVFQGNGTQTVATLGYSQTFSGNNTFSGATSTFGNSTATGTINVASGATISGSTKAVNIGTGGVAGSTTNITIGSASNTSTTTLQGTVNAPGLANGVKAWVNFNGTGTVAIRASYNVSSITDNGAGDYTMNFTTALADANYAAAGFAGDAAFSLAVTTSSWGTYTQTTSAFRFKVSYGATTIDTTNVHMTIIR
jgi:hypothetical protein